MHRLSEHPEGGARGGAGGRQVVGPGDRIARIEDPPLLRGAGRFAADMNAPGQLHMRVVRSQVAHGLLRSVDAAEALAMPGVVAVWTAADLEGIPPIGFRLTRIPGLEPYRQPILARDVVRYVGEPVAVVLADDPYRAEDAAEAVLLDVEEREPLLRATDPPGLFAEGLSTEAAQVRKEYGDLDAAFAAAAHVIELELVVGRQSGVPLETRGALALWNAEKNRLEMHGAAKVPHFNRAAIAAMLGLEREQIHLFEGHVGGGFGIRGELYPEDVLACLAALRLRRPVKWIEDRHEHLLCANHSRDQVHHIRAAVDARGVVLGVEDEFWLDQGAYIRTHAATVPDLTAAMLPGPYRFPAYRSIGHIRLTNKTPAGTYRAPGRYEGSFVRERLMDAVAARLGLDPATVRRANLIPREEIPFDRSIDALGTPVVYDSADFAGLLDRLLAHVGYTDLQRDLAARRAVGEMVGLGLGFFVEKSGLGPFDDVIVTLDASGGVEIVTGAASVGQGIETAMAQICAGILSVPPERIRVVHGQTNRIARGMGAFASRVTVMTGSATVMASEKLRARLLAAAAELLQTPAEELALRDGTVTRAAGPGPSLPLAEAARACADASGTLTAAASFEAEHMTYPYGIHLAVARLDPETCGVALERFVVAYDIGRAVNPMLVEGQIAGGAAQGIGGALLEEFTYDPHGQPLAATLADYLMPTLAEIPPVEVLLAEDAPSPLNPLGVKGAGEGGITAAGAAIASAIDAALGMPGAIRRLPISPQRLHEAMRLREGEGPWICS
ncbi:MAG: xanthine dehydrogenase family protein molybdopterin-binding subunit [Acetobacteraceae bacterium]|nr:xanthine dehydrogenase family protein molybdopterin-binding subunit [Acetobacteraceae bacterium]